MDKPIISINGVEYPLEEEVFALMMNLSLERDRYLKALQHISYNIEEVGEKYSIVFENPVKTN